MVLGLVGTTVVMGTLGCGPKEEETPAVTQKAAPKTGAPGGTTAFGQPNANSGKGDTLQAAPVIK